MKGEGYGYAFGLSSSSSDPSPDKARWSDQATTPPSRTSTPARIRGTPARSLIVTWAQNVPTTRLQTTALVHEAYLRLADQANPRWQNRAHFFAVAARAMRTGSWSATPGASAPKSAAAVTLKMGVGRFGARLAGAVPGDSRICTRRWKTRHARLKKSSVVELKYFGGLNYDEMAEVLKISRVTVRRDGNLPKCGCTRNCTARLIEMTKLNDEWLRHV